MIRLREEDTGEGAQREGRGETGDVRNEVGKQVEWEEWGRLRGRPLKREYRDGGGNCCMTLHLLSCTVLDAL